MIVETSEINLELFLQGSGMEETERESLAGLILEAANSGDPPIDLLSRYMLALGAIQWCLYAGKINKRQCGNLMSLVGELLGIEGDLLAAENENEEENA